MIEERTANHFDTIASTWDRKEWVNSVTLNIKINNFVRSTEKKIGLQKKPHKTSLYFGIGTGALFRYLKRYNIAGVDRAASMLGQCPEGIIRILSEVENLPFLMDNQFHLTFSRNLLKHCQEPALAVESMYRKTRSGCVAVMAESVVLCKEDRDVPTALVRMTDPTHPPFRTVEEAVALFERWFPRVDYKIVYHRSAWLKRWIEAEQASKEVHRAVLDLYRSASRSFKRRHEVEIVGDEIISTVPWLLVRALK